MDGNGRWAELHGVSVAEGHRAGTRALRRTVEAAIELGIGTLVVYAFSTENWARPADEVADLLVLLSETIDGELPDLAKQGVRTRFLGRRDRVDDAMRVKMRELEDGDRAPRDARSSGSRSTTAAGRSSSRRPDGSWRTESSAKRRRRAGDRVAAVRARARRPGPARAHLGRAPPLELHALGGGVRGARLRGDALARLRRGRAACRGRGVRARGSAASGRGPAREPALVADRRHGGAAARRARPRLGRRLVALRARARRWPPGAPRALRHVARRCARS